MIRRAVPTFLLGLLVAVTAACTEDPIVAVDSETAPGFSTPTIEVYLESGELEWRDTTYWGFAVPSSAAFSLIAEGDDLRSRPLGRFSTIPDSLFVDTARVAIDSFTTAAIRVAIDTARSELPAGNVELAAWSLARSFDADEATWLRAAEGEPWSTPGGDLDVLLGIDSLTFEPDTLGAVTDTALVWIDVNVDSLLTSWRETDGEAGFALTITGPAAVIRASTIALVATAVPEGSDTVLSVVRGALPETFIFNPPTPAPTTRLRLAGLPAARHYMAFQLPDSLGPIELRGATINRATLEFRPTSAPAEPFDLKTNISAQAVRLLADPFVFGEKTPIGSPLGDLEALWPDSLASGNTMQYDITSFIRLWSQAPLDSVPGLWVGFVPVPENQQIGYWEFFSREDAPGLRPVVHLLFTPNPSFLLP